jgi:alpha-1,2-mannosyltransferase
MRPHAFPNPDFFQDWASARNHRFGLPVYSPHTATIPLYLGRPAAGVEREATYNAHPPPSVLMTLPLARLSFSDAMLAWNLVSLAALGAGLALLAAGLRMPGHWLMPAVVLLPLGLPIYGNFQQGQLTPLLFAMIAATWAMDRMGRPAAAGMLVGSAAAMKLFPAYLVVVFAVRRSWRALLAAGASFAVWNLATILVLGWEPYRDYLQVVMHQQEMIRSWACNLSVAGFWHKLFDPTAELALAPCLWTSPRLARFGIAVSDLMVTAVVAAMVHRARTPEQRDVAFAAAVSAMLLVSPVTWDISMLLLLLPIAVLARTAGTSRGMAVVLMSIFLVLWLPQQQLVELIPGVNRITPGTSAYLLGPASAKFYALLLTFTLGAAGARLWASSPRPPTMDADG